MAGPLGDTDKHGLATLARRWTPKGMRTGNQDAADLLDAWADSVADVFNLLLEFEDYLPIILNPTRCLANDLDNIIELNGIQVVRSLTIDQKRRLAILGPTLREWRGAFRSHRSVAGALTGGPVIVRAWLLFRTILDITTMEITVLDDGDENVTQIFVLGQGPSGEGYNEEQVQLYLETLAVPILDDIELTECYALTRWRDGFAGWNAIGLPQLIPSSVFGEYEAVDIGPGVDPISPINVLKAPTKKNALTGPNETIWNTFWFVTNGATAGDEWEVHVYANGTNPFALGFQSYMIRIGVGNFECKVYRQMAGPPVLLGTFPTNIADGFGDYHRLDVIVMKNALSTKVRLYVDNDPSFIFVDPTVSPRPNGVETLVATSMTPPVFTTGILRVTAITAREQD